MPLITCPNCSHQFEPNDALRSEIERDLRQKMSDWQRKKESEFKTREQQLEEEKKQQELAFQQRLTAEKQQLQDQLQTQLRKEIAGDYDVQVKMLQQRADDGEVKLEQARKKELEFLQKAQAIEQKERELELQLQKMLLDERSRLAETIRKEEAEKTALRETDFRMKMQEMEHKLEQQRKLAEEMKRKAEQGSMQSQGEAQELALEDLLRQAFPFDSVTEVAKGIRGADCLLTIRNQYGQECGRIIFESKRTQHFSNEWVDKLKADLRSQGADIAVLVTQAFPKDMDRFGEKDGVWICSFSEAKALVQVLRQGIIKVYMALQSQDNKGDKMNLLYTYLTSNEFAEQWQAIREGFLAMRQSIHREREQMEKLWKQREKQLEKVLLNMAHFKGSIEGIAGQDVHLNLLEEGGTMTDEG